MNAQTRPEPARQLTRTFSRNENYIEVILIFKSYCFNMLMSVNVISKGGDIKQIRVEDFTYEQSCGIKYVSDTVLLFINNKANVCFLLLFIFLN